MKNLGALCITETDAGGRHMCIYKMSQPCSKTIKLYRCPIDVLRWGKTAVKSATEMALWLLRHQRSFASSHQERIKIRSRLKDYVDVSLGPPNLTKTKLGHNSLLPSPE